MVFLSLSRFLYFSAPRQSWSNHLIFTFSLLLIWNVAKHQGKWLFPSCFSYFSVLMLNWSTYLFLLLYFYFGMWRNVKGNVITILSTFLIFFCSQAKFKYLFNFSFLLTFTLKGGETSSEMGIIVPIRFLIFFLVPRQSASIYLIFLFPLLSLLNVTREMVLLSPPPFLNFSVLRQKNVKWLYVVLWVTFWSMTS